MLTQTALLTLLPFASAHFHLHYPAPRGDDTEKQADFPCGGYPDVGATRTPVSLTSLPLSMELGHDENLISVFLAIGNEPGGSFSVELLPTVSEVGLGDFCWASVPLPEGLNITAGSNATVQVITNGHAGNGLYNCADITFSDNPPPGPESCTNNTGITAEFFTGSTLANTTVPEEHEGHGDNASSSASASASDAAASATSASSAGVGAVATAAGWGVLGAGVMGAVAML